ncbi:MAG: SLC26A/SulP transporter family protein [Elusimicrobiota bacterium]
MRRTDFLPSDWREHLPADAMAGLTAMLVALPQAIAFGVVIFSALGPKASAAGALAGMVGAASIGLIAPLLGGTKRLVSAPCAPAAAVMAALGASLAAAAPGGDPERLILLLALTAVLSASLQLVYGFIGGGRLIKYIPYPVVSGYLSGVAVLIFLGQVPKLFGWPKGAGLWTGLTVPGLWRWPSLAVGICSMSAMALAPRITRKLPGPIVGLAGGLLSYIVLSLGLPELRTLDGNPYIIGALDAGSASLSGILSRWSAAASLSWADLQALFIPALTLSVLLSMDTLKTCVVLDAMTRSRHDSNKELIGQGAANLASALLGGIPGAGTMGATVVNMQSGGRTRLSGAFVGVFALLTVILLSRLVAWVPIASLAGILIMVAWKMFDRKSFKLLRNKSTVLDFVVLGSVVVAAVTTELMVAAGVGLALSFVLFIRNQIRESVIRRKTSGDRMFSKQRRLPAEMEVLERDGGKTVVCELQGTLFFGTADQLFSELEQDLKTRKYIILDLRRVQSLDFTAAHMLEQIEAELRERGGRLLLSELPQALPSGQDLKAYFDEVGVVAHKTGAKVFDALDDALAYAEERLLEDAKVSRGAEDGPLKLDQIHLFREFEPALVQALAGCVDERSCRAGERVFWHGESGDEIFIIRRGKVRIEMPLGGKRAHHLATFGRGDFFGDMAFIDRGVRSADAVAVTDTDLFVLSRARFNEGVWRNALLGTLVFARLAQALALRLRQTDGEVQALQEG